MARFCSGPSGTIGVMTPLLARVVSMAFEGFRQDVLTGVGAALAVGGNLLMLRPKIRVSPERSP